MRYLQRMKSKSGMSIVEVVIAVAIFTLITAAAFSMYTPINEITKSVRSDNDMQRIVTASENYISRQLRNAVEVQIHVLNPSDWATTVPQTASDFIGTRVDEEDDPRVIYIRQAGATTHLYDIRLKDAYTSGLGVSEPECAALLANFENYRVFNGTFYSDIALDYGIELNEFDPDAQIRDKTFLKIKMEALRGGNTALAASQGGNSAQESANILLSWIGDVGGTGSSPSSSPLNQARFYEDGSTSSLITGGTYTPTGDWAIFYHNNIDIDREPPNVPDPDVPCPTCGTPPSVTPILCTDSSHDPSCPGTYPCFSPSCIEKCRPACYATDDITSDSNTPCGGSGCEFHCNKILGKIKCPGTSPCTSTTCSDPTNHCTSSTHGYGCWNPGCGKTFPNSPHCTTKICCRCGSCDNCEYRCMRRNPPLGFSSNLATDGMIGGCGGDTRNQGSGLTGDCVCCLVCYQPNDGVNDCVCDCLSGGACTPDDEYKLITAPKCDADGVAEGVCTVCGDPVDAILPALGTPTTPHDTTGLADYHNDAQHKISCSRTVTYKTLGDGGTSVSIGSGTIIVYAEPDELDWNCGEVDYEDHSSYSTIPKSIINASTCQNAGRGLFDCSKCGSEFEKDLPLADHTFGDTWVRISDTQHERVCTVCISFSDKASHVKPDSNSGNNTETPWKAFNDDECRAQCTANGCNHQFTESHTYTSGKCTRCNHDEPAPPSPIVAEITGHNCNLGWTNGSRHACTLQIKITNNGSTNASLWTITVQVPSGATVNQASNVTASISGTTLTVSTTQTWMDIAAGETYTIDVVLWAPTPCVVTP